MSVCAHFSLLDCTGKMSVNHSNTNTFPSYKFYFDDIEELFFNRISFKSLLLPTIFACLLTILSLILLFTRSRSIFLACLIPLIYALIFYDFLQLLSINLLKYHFVHLNERMFSLFCRWPYYVKALAEAGQCFTLIFFFAIRYQKVQYLRKHKYIPNSSPIHTRALTFVCFLFILYANNWITHLKVEKIHLITLNESQHEINIQEYPLLLYGKNDVKMTDRQRFYFDFDKYAQNSGRNRTQSNPSERIIHNQKDDSVHEIIIKIPYGNFFASRNRTQLKKPRRKLLNHTRKKISKSYRIHRCTYGQRNFLLINLWSLIHSIFYLLLILYYLTTIYRYPIPKMTMEYHRKLYDQALAIGRKKSAERHKQLILLTHLRQFQYLIVYCHTIFVVIRLFYTCLLTLILCFSHSPFQWSSFKLFFYILFLIVYYSIPLRLICLFVYLFCSLFSSTISSVFSYIFHTKLHFSCQLQKPTIRFRLHIRPYDQPLNIQHDEHSSNSFVVDFNSSMYEEHSTVYPNESIGIGEENSSGINHGLLIENDIQQTQL